MILMAKPNMIGNEKKYMNEAFDSNWIAPLGEFVDRFEADICKYVGSKHAVALSSGTAALHLAMIALGVNDGDIVLCPDITFIASINPAVYCGATPIFIDIDYSTLNVDIKCLQKAIQEYKPKAFVMVHMYGMPCCNAEEIVKLCHDNDVLVIEDATEALGSKVNDKFCGTLGDCGCFSFNGNKIVTSSGGGMFVTDNDELARKVKHLATQAKEPVPYYLHNVTGYNYRLSNICAAIGVGQLESIEYFIKKKNDIHDLYDGLFKTFSSPNNAFSNYWLSIIKVRNADSFVSNMKNSNIETRRVWMPLHEQPCFNNKKIGFVTKHPDKPMSQMAFETCVCMPSDPCMSDDDVEYVVTEAKKYV